MEEIETNNLLIYVNRIGIYALFPWFIICLVWLAAFNSTDTDNGACSCAIIMPFALYPLWLIVFVKLSRLFLSTGKLNLALLISSLPFALALGPLLIMLIINKVL